MSDKPSKSGKGRKTSRTNSSRPARNQINWSEQPDYEMAVGIHGSHLTGGGFSPRTIPQRAAAASSIARPSTVGNAMTAAPEVVVTASVATAGPVMAAAAPQAPTQRRQQLGPYRYRTAPPQSDFWLDSSTSDDEEDRERKRARRAARDNRRAARPQTLSPRMNRSHQAEDSGGDEEKEQKTTQQLEADHRLAELIEKELFELQGCDAKLGERVETNENFITRPPSQYINYSSDNEKGTRKDIPKKKKYHRAISDASVIRKMAKKGEPQPEMCRITYKTEVETERGNNKWVHRGDIVEMVYGRIVFWNNKQSIKALNAWRYQIFNRNFDNLRTSRLPWTVQEMEYVYELLQAQFDRGRRRIAWNRLANDFNRHFNGVRQDAGAKVLKQGQKKIPEIKEERFVPYRSGNAIDTACYKDGGAKGIMKRAKTTVGHVNPDPEAEENPNPEAGGEARDESEDEDMLPNPNPLTIAQWAPKPRRAPKAKAGGGNGKDEKKSTASKDDGEGDTDDESGSDADVDSDDEPLIKTVKGKKATPQKRKRGESDDNDSEQDQPAKKKVTGMKGPFKKAPAKNAPAYKAAGKKVVSHHEAVVSSDESDSDGIPAVAKKIKTALKKTPTSMVPQKIMLRLKVSPKT
ncbi:hypothetical protein B0J14DRAFT_560160 [Halenospora varia]|nr:hypothetical protein B0J14DRAFT_560160 [Halenospora varia]